MATEIRTWFLVHHGKWRSLQYFNMDMEKPPLMTFPRKPRDFPWLNPLGFSNVTTPGCEESLHGELGTRGYVAPEAGKPVGDRKEGYEQISDLDTSIFSKSLIKLISKIAISIYLDLSWSSQGWWQTMETMGFWGSKFWHQPLLLHFFDEWPVAHHGQDDLGNKCYYNFEQFSDVYTMGFVSNLGCSKIHGYWTFYDEALDPRGSLFSENPNGGKSFQIKLDPPKLGDFHELRCSIGGDGLVEKKSRNEVLAEKPYCSKCGWIEILMGYS